MKYLVLICFLILFSCQNTLPKEGLLKVELETALDEFSQAFLRADEAALSTMLTDRYMHSNSGSAIIRKKNWLDYIKSRKAELDSGKLKIDSYENQDVAIEIYGNTAVVNGLNIAKGVRDSVPFQTRISFTHFWVREEEGWKRAAFHDSKLD